MQQDILPTTKTVVENAKSVSINKNAVERFCVSFSIGNAAAAKISNVAELDIFQSIGLVCIFNCVNFCFWAAKGQEKWATKINDKMIDGAAGLFRALEKSYSNGVPLLNAHFLQNLNREKFNELLKGI